MQRLTRRTVLAAAPITLAFGGQLSGVAARAGGKDGLKPFNPATLRRAVEATGKELLVPGAMVLLLTPQGEFAFGYGSTELGMTTRRTPTRISGWPPSPRR